MRFKKISILVMAVAFLFPNLAKADDVFLDNNAISEFSDANSSIVISEYNTGKNYFQTWRKRKSISK